MSFVQRFLTAILPRSWSRDMEESSRAWKVKCGACGHERSVWDLGGIRWKAASSPRWRLTCPSCGDTGWHSVYRP